MGTLSITRETRPSRNGVVIGEDIEVTVLEIRVSDTPLQERGTVKLAITHKGKPYETLVRENERLKIGTEGVSIYLYRFRPRELHMGIDAEGQRVLRKELLGRGFPKEFVKREAG